MINASTITLQPVPPVLADGRRWNMIVPDRVHDVEAFWIDRTDYRTWSVIRNNFPAVRDKMRTMGAADAEQLTSATSLYRILLALPENERREALRVPWRMGVDELQDQTFSSLADRVQQGSGTEKVLPFLAVLGLVDMVEAVSQEGTSEAAEEAAKTLAAAQIAADQAEATNRKQKWNERMKWIIPVGALLLFIALLLIIRATRK